MTHCTTTSKESVCRIICMLCQQTSRWFANVNMTSYCDVTKSVYPGAMTTIGHCSILEFGRRHPLKQSPRASPDLCTTLFAGYRVDGRTVRKQVQRVESRMEYYCELRTKNAQNIKAPICPLHLNVTFSMTLQATALTRISLLLGCQDRNDRISFHPNTLWPDL